ncbi:MAG TPA: MFS transporter [Caulobacteraceae bacterium]|nr:MFS transporter [Caulobacteraceae bacterium]
MRIGSASRARRPERAPRSGAGRAWRGGPRLALGLLLLAGVTNYIDRITLSVANPLIAADLHLRPSGMGLLLSAFLWAYALAQAPVGALIDRFGPRRALGGAMALWSAAQAAAGLATGLPSFIAARLLLGVGEAPQFPAAARAVSQWFEPRHRGLATGVFNSASTLAPALGPPLVTALMLGFGWRGAFIATGLAGGLVALLWLTLYRDQPAPVEVRSMLPWRRLISAPTLWVMALGNAGSGYMSWFYAAWLPGYLEMERHLSIPRTGWVAAAPYLCGFVGSLAGGWLCDRLQRAGLAPIASRKAPIVAGLAAGGAFTALAILARTDVSAVVAIAAALFFANLAGAAIWALAVSAAPPGAVASVGAIQNFGGLMGGALAPIVTGLLVEATHSFVPALATTALAAFGGATVYLVGVRRPIAT